MKRIQTIFVAILVVILAVASASAGGKTDATTARGKPVIAVSILPQQYFVEQIAGNRVTVLVLVGNGQNPHAYEPTPAQMASLSGAKAWVLSGTDFEIALRPKIAAQFSNLTIIDGTKGVKFRELQEYEQEAGEHHEGEAENHEGEADEHHDSNIDRHSWLGREPAKIMAAQIRDVLNTTDPAGKAVYDANYATLIKTIDATYTKLAVSLASLRGKTVLVFHPSFGYFLDEFGIKQASIETGGKEPTAKALSDLIAKAKADKVPAIFVQAQFPVNAAKTVAAEAGAQVVALDPLAPDWLVNIERIGEALKKAYK